MQHGGIDLPTGYRLAFHPSIDSTNAEGLRQAVAGQAGGLWVWAAEQRQGRGRAGRPWASRGAGLYASLMLRPRVPITTALQLPLLAGVAAHDAVSSLAAGAALKLDLRLKWPNDVLVDNAKLGGILLESISNGSGDSPIVVIGTGINIAQPEDDLGRPVASLHGLGLRVGAVEAFAALAWTMAEWLARWNDGVGFDLIREAWIARAQAVGAPISVRLGNDLLTGTFLGIDEAGALRLGTNTGGERRVTAGDVSFGTEAA